MATDHWLTILRLRTGAASKMVSKLPPADSKSESATSQARIRGTRNRPGQS